MLQKAISHHDTTQSILPRPIMQSDTFWQLASLSQPWLGGSHVCLSVDSPSGLCISASRVVGFDCSSSSDWASFYASEHHDEIPPSVTEALPPAYKQLQHLSIKTKASSCSYSSGGSGLQQRSKPRAAVGSAPEAAVSRPDCSSTDARDSPRGADSQAQAQENTKPGEEECLRQQKQQQNRRRTSHPIAAASPQSAAGFPGSTSPASSWSSQQAGQGTAPQKTQSTFEQLYSARTAATAEAQNQVRRLRDALLWEREEVSRLQAQLRDQALSHATQLDQLAYEHDVELQALAYEKDVQLWHLACDRDSQLHALAAADAEIQQLTLERDAALASTTHQTTGRLGRTHTPTGAPFFPARCSV